MMSVKGMLSRVGKSLQQRRVELGVTAPRPERRKVPITPIRPKSWVPVDGSDIDEMFERIDAAWDKVRSGEREFYLSLYEFASEKHGLTVKQYDSLRELYSKVSDR